MNYSLYKHTCPDGMAYIGITEQDPEQRWKEGWGYKDHKKFFKHIVRYGWDNIQHQILIANLSYFSAIDKEKELIHKLGSSSLNVQHYFAPPISDDSFNQDDALSQSEVFAIDLWSVSIFRNTTDDSRKKIQTSYPGWTRTVVEFASRDKERIMKELIYIQTQGDEMAGRKPHQYTSEEFNKAMGMLQ